MKWAEGRGRHGRSWGKEWRTNVIKTHCMKFSRNQSNYYIIKPKGLGHSLICRAISKLLPMLLYFLHSWELLKCHILFSSVGVLGIIWQKNHLAQDEESSVPSGSPGIGTVCVLQCWPHSSHTAHLVVSLCCGFRPYFSHLWDVILYHLCHSVWLISEA